MKRITFLLIASLAFVLNGCLVEIVDPGTGLPSGVTIFEAAYGTNYSATVNGEPDRSIICDDRTTVLSYSFRYSGNLGSWVSYIKGSKGGETGRLTLDLNSKFVQHDVANRQVTVTYDLLAGSAPLLMSPQASAVTPNIIITPVPDPVVLGSSKLFLEFPSASRPYQFSTKDLPVVDNCPQ
jgi:hypothetical protein